MIEKQRTRQVDIASSLDYAQYRKWATSLYKFFGKTEPEKEWVLHLSLGAKDSPILLDAMWAFDMQRKVNAEDGARESERMKAYLHGRYFNPC